MPTRPLLNALSVALLAGTALHADPGCTQPIVPEKWPVEVERPTIALCPAVRPVVDIKGSADPVVRRQQRDLLIAKIAEDNTTIRLGPDVDLDFSDLPASAFPIHFRRCVTLTSVNAFTDILPTPHVAEHVQPKEIAMAPAPADVTPFGAAPAQARSPRSLGPVLRYGSHRVSGVTETFFEIHCYSPHGADNDGVRISGIRFYGPSFGQQSEKNAAIRVVRCVDVDISNVEVAGWGGDGIAVIDDRGPDHSFLESAEGGRISNPGQVRIHDSFFHHNQHPNLGGFACIGGSAEGYGVLVGDGAWARISRNVFDFNRHAIATTGNVGGYDARHNLVLKGGGYHGTACNPTTHSFDVHGTGCWWSGNLCGDAGRRFWFVGNAFHFRKSNAIKIRGKPDIGAYIAENIFPHPGLEADWGDDAVHLNTTTNVQFGPGNVIDVDTFGEYGVCDFDGDGVDDLFLATGATWWFSSFGEFHWSYLSLKKERRHQVRLGYFDGDLRCDVLAERNGQWMISSGGTGDWQSLGAFGAPWSEVQFGRFDPNRRDYRIGMTLRTTHAFQRAPDGQWWVTPLSQRAWQPVQSSDFSMSQLRFGDFTGDGVTDVLAVVDGRWSISESATTQWRRLNPTLGDPVENLFIANMDHDDNIDDLLRLDRQTVRIQSGSLTVDRTTLTWWRSKNGTDPWTQWKQYVFQYTPSGDTVTPHHGFAGRFGAARGGGTLVIGPDRFGHFFSAAEIAAGAAPDWSSLYAY
ncbi:MAG: right-handed parallel beta-helix repeat-containing protein [Betaproteobacteria bacterium]